MSDVPDRPGRVRGSTRSVGVLGWPVERSLSPAIHNAAFVALGLDWVYVPLPVAPAELPAALRGLVALGFAGANVTMPHKTRSAELIEDLSEDARLLRAANTIVVGADGLAGHNSDAVGFERFLRGDVGFDASGRSALLFGAGGGARACALAAARCGLASLFVAVREASRADDLRAALEGSATEVRVVGFDDASGIEADLIVNATPLGVHGEELPLPSLPPGVVGVDLLYRPGVT
ncbi:MAG TPA: shikimate dehydrogenase, partial [Actinomycetota bacterium]